MYFQKDFQLEEIPSSSHISCMFYSTPSDGKYELHCHSYYEISYVINGHRFESCNGTEYPAESGSLFFYPPLVVHSNRNVTAVDVLVVQFSSDYLLNNTSPEFSNTLLSWTNSNAPFLNVKNVESVNSALSNLVNLCRTEHSEPSVSFEIKKSSAVLNLISELIGNDFIRAYKTPDSPMHIPQLDAVINYILAHPEEKNDMKKAAKIAKMSYYNFSRYFKSVIGFNFSEYCNLLKIRYAEELLVKTDLPISDIALKIGIDVPSYFTKLFKNISGKSPLDYRKSNKS